MKKQFWKAIPGYEGLYEMTLDGRIRSLNYLGQKGKIKELKSCLHPDGYYQIKLSKEGKRKTFVISQLMAITFLGHKPDGHKLVVDHKNEIKTDNRLENLQIITHRKNVTRSKKRNLPTGVSLHAKTKKYVAKIRIKGKQKYLGLFITPEEASQAYQKELKNHEKNKL